MSTDSLPDVRLLTDLGDSGICEEPVARVLHPAFGAGDLSEDVLSGVVRSLSRSLRRGDTDISPTLRPVGKRRDAGQDGGRAYARLVDSPFIEVWLIEWGPATTLELHDHGGASGAVALVRGELVETYASLAATRNLQHRHLGAGDSLTFGPDHIHEIWNPTGSAALSVHAYSPRLTSMTFYDRSGLVLGEPKRVERFDDESGEASQVKG